MKASATTIKTVQKLLPILQQSVKRVQHKAVFTLGLDVSSTFTGFTVLDPRGGLVRCGAMDLRKCNTTLQAAAELENELRMLKDSVMAEAEVHFGTVDTVNPTWNVGIEDFLKNFARRTFQTKGLFKLAQVNGIAAYHCAKIFLQPSAESVEPQVPLREPQLFAPNAIRAFHDLKVPKGARTRSSTSQPAHLETGASITEKPPNIKQIVFERASSELPKDLWQYGVRGGFQACNYDMADSYFTAKFALKDWIESCMLHDDALSEALGDLSKGTKLGSIVDRFLYEGHHLQNRTTESKTMRN